jgi:secreted trypsin-like serine protease
MLQGASGGPLVYQESDGIYSQDGIMPLLSSYGCQQGYLAVFTKVTSYFNWNTVNTGM